MTVRPGARLQNMTLSMILLFLLQTPAPKPEVRVPELERLMHQSINLHRRVNDREPLDWDETLAGLARAHSEDMAKRGYFKHVNPEGQTPMQRLQEAGYDKCRMVGENIHQNNLYSREITIGKKKTYDWNSMEIITTTTVKAWMDSEGHRQTILEMNYTQEGIGVALAPDDKVYITQIVCGEN